MILGQGNSKAKHIKYQLNNTFISFWQESFPIPGDVEGSVRTDVPPLRSAIYLMIDLIKQIPLRKQRRRRLGFDAIQTTAKFSLVVPGGSEAQATKNDEGRVASGPNTIR